MARTQGHPRRHGQGEFFSQFELFVVFLVDGSQNNSVRPSRIVWYIRTLNEL
jgi:hypothetical protein